MDWNPSEKPVWQRPIVLIGAGIAFAAVVILFAVFFAPKGTTTLSQDLGDIAQGDAMAMAEGEWKGADAGHRASGSVQLLKDDRGHFLFFEDFDATSGPDVYLYASPDGTGTWRASEVTKIPMAGGAEDGQATLRGDFRVDLPADVDASSIGSLILWCDDFSVKFGHASLV